MVKLLIKYHADLDIQDSSGWTPLNTASSRGNTIICADFVLCFA